MRRALLALALLVALVAAGCGGDDSGDKGTSTSEYTQQIATLGTEVQKSLAGISDITATGLKKEELAARLDQGAKALDDASKRFAKITPPEDLAAAHQKIVKGLALVGEQFSQMADGERKGDTAAVAKALRGLSTSEGLKLINGAQQELEAKGVTVSTSSTG